MRIYNSNVQERSSNTLWSLFPEDSHMPCNLGGLITNVWLLTDGFRPDMLGGLQTLILFKVNILREATTS